jgi:hypothetical protein
MSKHKKLVKKMIQLGLVCLVAIIISVGIYFFTLSLADDSAPLKSSAEGAFQRDQGEINMLDTQLKKSGVAENRFIQITQDRENLDFLLDVEALKNTLRNAKTQHRLSSSFTLTPTNEVASDNKDITSSGYTAFEHPGMKLEFTAMSDTHIYAFLESLMRNAPGFILIEGISIKRSGDIDSIILDQMRAGAAPYLVDTTIEFNWIGLKEEAKKEDSANKPKTGGEQ